MRLTEEDYQKLLMRRKGSGTLSALVRSEISKQEVQKKDKKKYHNKPTEADGHKFASKNEEKRYQELKLMVLSGDIADLELHPRYPIFINDIKVCTYVADFKYLDVKASKEAGEMIRVVEDVKGTPSPVYTLKKRMVKAYYGIEIKEIK